MTQTDKHKRNTLSQKSQSRLGKLMGVRIVGVGGYVPQLTVKNEDLTELGCDADWIVQRTGILERRHTPEGLATSDLAVEAAQRCIEDAGVDPNDIDLLLLGTFTADMPLPSAACLVQEKMNLKAPALDLSAACASFVFALWTGMQFVATGCNQLVLVVGADCNSRVLNPADKKTYPLFGDGAGAVLLAPGDSQQGLLSYAVGSDGSGADLLCRPMGGSQTVFTQEAADAGQHFMQMEGRPIFKWAVRIVEDTIYEVLEDAGEKIDNVDMFIFHQANMRIINATVKTMGINPDKVANNLERYGNTSSGSIPLVLDEFYRQGHIKRGDLLLLSGFGAGLTWATVLLRW
ncbi:MAG: ketoacyl-ACP synthase III [Pirellulales bacterium]|nr:ketoacyl-ACP synthase III [Pirellulales bacterium]